MITPNSTVTVRIMHATPMHIFMWFRKNTEMTAVEAKAESIKTVFDFKQDYETGLDFFNYLLLHGGSQTKVAIGITLFWDGISLNGASLGTTEEMRKDYRDFAPEFDQLS